MTVLKPAALLLLIIIPLVTYIGWPRNRFRRTRDSVSLLLRAVIIALVVFGLANVQVVRSTDTLAVVFLVDVSDSMDTASREAATEYIQDTLAHMQPSDLAGVIAFGADAQVARSMSPARDLGPIRVTPQSGNTNLAAAIRLGLALFPGDAARRMVILSDGQPTIGDTMAAAQLAAAADVEISYVPYTRAATPEIQVRDVVVPTVLNEDQEFNLTVTIVSEQDTRATITVLASGAIVRREERDLLAGENSYTLRLRSGDAGFRDFSVQVDPPQDAINLYEDGFYQNNVLGAFSRVEGMPRVLVVGVTGQQDTAQVVPALMESGLEVDTIGPESFPTGIAGLADYDSVILVNIPASDLSIRSMEVMQRYVSDLGGGLVVIGGDQTYGPGGYFQTPLEEILPVEMRLKDQERMPQLTIAYVIDRSGSMGITGRGGGPSKLELASEAIIRSVEFLQPTDRAGVASFDVDAYWVAEIQDVSNRYELQRLVATLRPGGGTSIMAGMRLVSQSIIQEPSDLKHIILLTDGGANPAGLVNSATVLRNNENVTTSVISIGDDATAFLDDMAAAGGGHYHHVVDPSTIPTIFAQETVLATRAYIQEETFTPRLTAIHPIMQNIQSLPPLLGYVATTPRAAAQVVLRSPEELFEDPILAAWQYGLGRSVAFTSDATSQWAQNWVTWDEFASFWSQVVRWTITEGATNNLETRVVMEDEQARIIVDARDNSGEFLNGLNLQSNVVLSTAQDVQRVHLRQVAPGRYEGVFTPTEEGAYLLRINQVDANEDTGNLNLNQTTGWVMSYSPEYEIRDNLDDTVLETAATITGGSDLSAQPEAVFDHNIEAREAQVPIWPWLLFVATLLLPFDIGVRRLLVTRSDLQRFREWLFGREEVATSSSERLATLKQARNRVRHRVRGGDDEDEAAEASSTVGSLLRSRRDDRRSEHDDQDPAPQPQTAGKPRFTRSVQAPGRTTELPSARPRRNIGADLLRKRRSDPDEDEDDG